ncbi:hypothetical protein pipiens_009800 [Culex pipiens pipiens]|uniref:Uncharacterized protein n=1 Tax=Culex pipiens pipiens TaxID=38569 RepID=A0ABD1DDL4_CULPP
MQKGRKVYTKHGEDTVPDRRELPSINTNVANRVEADATSDVTEECEDPWPDADIPGLASPSTTSGISSSSTNGCNDVINTGSLTIELPHVSSQLHKPVSRNHLRNFNFFPASFPKHTNPFCNERHHWNKQLTKNNSFASTETAPKNSLELRQRQLRSADHHHQQKWSPSPQLVDHLITLPRCKSYEVGAGCAESFCRCDGFVVTMETPEYRTAFRALCEALRSVSETHTKAFEEVKAELVETNNKIDQLISKLPEPKTAPTWPSNKRRRSSSSSSSAKPEVPKASVGRKVMTTVPIVPTTNGDDNMMWMWLSSFPPTVTEDDIRAMVRECLSFDAEETIDVKMLVKKDADISKLRAVSFKIGVDVKHEDAAMDGDNWPAGVSFREFIFYDRKQTADVDNLGFLKNRRVE